MLKFDLTPSELRMLAQLLEDRAQDSDDPSFRVDARDMARAANALALTIEEGAAEQPNPGAAEFGDQAPAKKRVRMVCSDCGSTDLWSDATAVWSDEEQDWVLGGCQDNGGCNACGRDSKRGVAVEAPIDPREAETGAEILDYSYEAPEPQIRLGWYWKCSDTAEQGPFDTEGEAREAMAAHLGPLA